MGNRQLIAPIRLEDGTAKAGEKDGTGIPALALALENNGADALLLFAPSDTEEAKERAVSLIRQVSRATDLPLFGGGALGRLEDVKKLIYAGCKKVFFNYAKETERNLLPEAAARFGAERMIACASTKEELQAIFEGEKLPGGLLLLDQNLLDQAEVLLQSRADTGTDEDAQAGPQVLCLIRQFEPAACAPLLSQGKADGLLCGAFSSPDFSFPEAKDALRSLGIAVNTWESSLSFDDFRVGRDGLLPVVVQDYRTLEVLMVAYMNEEAFQETVRTGRMTYFSRSRRTLWVKGETSGHFQYVRELRIDCDEDTLLAKVLQIGAACHTGNRSCFYRPILQKYGDTANPMTVFEDVYAVIEDRRAHPKEGSYTNYLFDKGLDKILKKIGEESAEIIIAAKNPDPDELIYEIADFLYHAMVLMSERGLSWEDITEELAKR